MLQEILSGVAREKLFSELEDHLSVFPMIAVEREDYARAARLRNNCKKKDVQVGTVDALIAAVCIKNDLLLLSTDKDFQLIANNSELKLIKVED